MPNYEAQNHQFPLGTLFPIFPTHIFTKKTNKNTHHPEGLKATPWTAHVTPQALGRTYITQKDIRNTTGTISHSPPGRTALYPTTHAHISRLAERILILSMPEQRDSLKTSLYHFSASFITLLFTAQTLTFYPCAQRANPIVRCIALGFLCLSTIIPTL